MPVKSLKSIFIVILLSITIVPLKSKGFSILAHEAIIDAAWPNSLLPLLKKKYPAATDSALISAHSYAYGGSLIVDIGYMPGGNVFFTDLLHYVRSGDLVVNLIDEAENLNEYAFALGALSHYMADKYGHSMATNVTVPMVYPDLRKKFGNVVTYEEDHTSHSRMEFAYDALQVGRGNYATSAYHAFIGFNVTAAPLERAFVKTYGIELSALFKNFDSSVATLRWGVRNLFPVLTAQAWKANKAEILKANPKALKRNYKYKMSRNAYKQEFGGHHGKADLKGRIAGFLVKVLPKVGPLKNFKFVYPGPAGEKIFRQTLDTILVNYTAALKRVEDDNFNLPDINFDTGQQVKYGDYRLADETYYQLVSKLDEEGLECMTASLKDNILKYYRNAELEPFFKERTNKVKRDFIADLQKVKQTPPVPVKQVIM